MYPRLTRCHVGSGSESDARPDGFSDEFGAACNDLTSIPPTAIRSAYVEEPFAAIDLTPCPGTEHRPR